MQNKDLFPYIWRSKHETCTGHRATYLLIIVTSCGELIMMTLIIYSQNDILYGNQETLIFS